MILDSDASIADEDRFKKSILRLQQLGKRSQQRRRVGFDRGRRQTIAYENQHRRFPARSMQRLEFRDFIVTQSAAALGPTKIFVAVGGFTMELDESILARPIGADLGHHRIDGARMIGAKLQQRSGQVARARASDIEPRRRFFSAFFH